MDELILEKISMGIQSGRVCLANMAIKDTDIDEILKTIVEKVPDLIALDLDSNEITDLGSVNIAQHLKNCINIKELSLQYNNIGEEGAKVLFRTFPNVTIPFHGNKIRDQGQMQRIVEEARGI